jgi:hypothetical protein
MGRERRTLMMLGALAVVLGVAAVYRYWPSTAADAPAAPSARGTPRTAGGGAQELIAPDVHLEALERERPTPGDIDRNLFRFKSKPAPLPPPGPVAPRAADPPAPPVPVGPPPPPPVPPIPFKFIGILEVPGQARRVAILSDARGVYHGREGDIIEGRYRILKIGTESIEMAEVDGRARQTIRLSGQ